MQPKTERRLFQMVVAIAGLVPVSAGLAGALFGVGAFDDGAPPALDPVLLSHVRYLSGLLLGIGLVFWATLAGPEKHGPVYLVLTAIVAIGGIARLAGHLFWDVPLGPANLFALAMELGVTPAIWLWRRRIEATGAH